MAMLLVNLPLSIQEQTSNGIIYSHCKGKNGDEYMLKFRYFSEYNYTENKTPKYQLNPKRFTNSAKT
jgi:hypothetical protein